MRTLILFLLSSVFTLPNLEAQVKYHPYYLGFTPDTEKIVLIGSRGIGDMIFETYDIKNKEKVSKTLISSFYFGIHYALPEDVYLSNSHIAIKNVEAGATSKFVVFDILSGEQITDDNQVRQIADKTVALRTEHPNSGNAEGIYQPHIILNDGRFVAIDEHSTATLTTRINFHNQRGRKTDSKVITVPRGEVFAITQDETMYAILKPGAIKIFRFDTFDEEVKSIPIKHELFSKGIVGLVLNKAAKGRDLEKLFYLSKSSFKGIRSETEDKKAPFPDYTCYTCNTLLLGAKHAWVCQTQRYRWIYVGVLREGKNDVRESLDAARKSAYELIPMLFGAWGVFSSRDQYPAGVAVHNEVRFDDNYPLVRFSSFRSNSDANRNYNTNVYFFVFPEEK